MYNLMANRITVEAWLRRAGTDKKKFLVAEREFGLTFGEEMPIPRNGQGHRQFDEKVADWLKHLLQLRAQGMDWIQARAELKWYEPRVASRPKRQTASSSRHYAEVY
jgi:hypothetical protein